ncbi:hypothetical protein QFC22_000324 [Naganishia vaughanmartiniae]|uniref:Uncharacterized protein n=1 Tax=Naganishia vaughanmartiniae TaxID=1424756 RepID=A0ACC2XMR8_9TREE|nr:hypothetical protein QFC22_000324 [Naganishia vaughanmartiniae]
MSTTTVQSSALPMATNQPPSATSNTGIQVPPQVLSIGLGFIASAFCAVTLGFFLRMYITRRRATEAAGGTAPRWIDVFFSIVEHRGSGARNGRNASSGFLYFEPGYPGGRRFMGGAGGGAGKTGREDWVVPTLFECDVEVGEEKQRGAEGELLSSHLQPMTTYSKSLIPGGDVSSIPEGTPLGISVLIQMPTALWRPRHNPHSDPDDDDDEIPLPELSIGVLDLCIASTSAQEARPVVEVEIRKDEKWTARDMEKVREEAEVVHLEYRR